MSNIADALKQEIARVARKELKDEIAALRKLASTHRSDIAALKRELKALHGVVKGLQKGLSRPAAAPSPEPQETQTKRRGGSTEFSAEQLATHRAELGLTQAQMARLIGASALSVYKWESGKVQPRAVQQEQIAAALKLGKRAVKAKLQEQEA
ncbi:helix-turn-helix domain-containing protein [Hydrogenophaga sp. OTU3427]|uniref:helix-turn-helix domain-containing protein n=1 Tax=Hydrogenophaga sp. OTU3427 TaxID=3043856 RepID=UPI00313DBC62